MDKIGECLVDPSQRGSIVHYQCGHTVKCRRGKRARRDGLGASKVGKRAESSFK